MSGTSLDGIDVALVKTDGEAVIERGPFLGIDYDPPFRLQLAEALEQAKTINERTQRPGMLEQIEQELTARHAEAVQTFLQHHGIGLEAIDLIGFHGQTVLHRPDAALTVQLGDGKALARLLQTDVVFDMRANDMRFGGQGAPLAPVWHRALTHQLAIGTGQPVAFVNIGGIANITYVGPDEALLAFDCGPGNALIDQWVQAGAGIPYDQNGMIASEGQLDQILFERYLASPFFTSKTRSSLDRFDFEPPKPGEIGLEDGARTLAYVTAAAIAASRNHLPEHPVQWILCGGGRNNPVIRADLTEILNSDGSAGLVVTAEDCGFDGDAMEAEAWAYLAVRARNGLPLTYPGTTGVTVPKTGGVLAPGRG